MTASGAQPAVLGRGAEIDRIRQLLAAAGDGSGSVLWIDGEAGIGKTALLDQVLAEAASRGCAVRSTAADAAAKAFPLRVLLDCLGLGAAGPDEVLAEVRRLCGEAPLVLAIDDLHLADETSLLVWRRLASRTGRLPLLLAATAHPARRDLAAGLAASRIALPPLGGEVTAQLAARLAGTAEIGPRLRAQLAGARGNPGYVRRLVLSQPLEVAAGIAEVVSAEPPREVAEAVAAGLRTLTSDARDVLRLAALLGSPFPATDLHAVSERPMIELARHVEEAMTAGLLEETGPRLTFRHGLVRQALRETTPGALRAALHHRAARALHACGTPVERIGEQLLASAHLAESEFDDWALDWLAEDGRSLARRGPECAEQLLATAIPQLRRDDPRRAELRATRVLALVQLNRAEQVRDLAERALADSSDQPRAAELTWHLTWSLAALGLAEEATAVAEEALDQPGFDRSWLARMNAMLGRVLLTEDQFEAADGAVERAVTEAGAARDDYARGLALHVRGSGLARRCDLSEAVICFEEAAAALGDAPEHTDLRLQVLGDRMMLLFALGRSDEADAALHELLEIAERSATESRLAAIRLSAAYHCFTVGRWDDATAELEAAAELTAHMTEPERSRLHGLSAMIAGQREEHEAFRHHLAELGPAERGFPLVAEVLRAEIDGETDRAVQLLSGFLERGDRFATRYVFLPQLVRLAMEIGDAATATAANDACAEDASVGAVPNILAASQHCRGLLDRDPPALRAAIELYRKTNQSPKCARALEDLALLHAERAEPAAARKAYAEAAELFQALGATWDLRRVDARMRAHGLQRTRRRAQRATTGWASLTKTERRVALLVGEGLGNPDIAAELCSSRRTVEVHVSHVLSKLGVRSRVDIAVEATRHRRDEVHSGS
ncbi:helix-turn-helix transcriptional regulator [Saccharopolyspora griseoalba]|uniref:LuxR C-terminal-related transcriptional regulator n=1 Tax=Saccharopolyspora griseoalba TaxID=1431848 RepID=A0ABW2LML0_9PSEU